jgi:ABC-type multidrug transport system permease subunit
MAQCALITSFRFEQHSDYLNHHEHQTFMNFVNDIVSNIYFEIMSVLVNKTLDFIEYIFLCNLKQNKTRGI